MKSGRSWDIPLRQFDPGTFEVRKYLGSGQPVLVGYLYVEGAGSNMTTEHWALAEEYASPQSQEHLEVKRMSQGYGSFNAFLTAMHQAQPSEAPFQYIRADCTSYTTLPEPE